MAQAEPEGAHKTGWEMGTDIFSDFEHDNEISSDVHSWLICCSVQKGSPALGQLRAIKPALRRFHNWTMSLFSAWTFISARCCSSNPQLGEVPVEMVFFFLNQQVGFFFLFFTVCKLSIAKTHISLFDFFSIYFILTHKLKKMNSDNKTKVFCFSSLFGLKHLPLCLFAHGKS